MTRWLLAFLSRDWAGLAFALLLLAVGAAAALWGDGVLRIAGITMGVLAVPLGAGSVVHIAGRVRVGKAIPPPGRLLDVGGHRIHCLAEGPQDGLPPLVWFGGGHSGGSSVHYLHAAFRAGRRSILIDRPGTGWSDAGPFPRTTAGEAREVIAALEVSGESGPFIFVGYSFGGLLVANIARRRPDLVAQLVLLDPTPLDTIIYGPRLDVLRKMRRDMLATAILRLFGYRGHLTERRMAKNPAHAAALARDAEVNGPAHAAARKVERNSKNEIASYSIFKELSPTGAAACGWETVVYDGDLQDLPVALVAPGDANEVKAEPEIGGAGEDEGKRMLRFFALSRERYMAASSNTRRIVTPPGSTHQFVLDEPDFVIATIEQLLANSPRATRQS